MSMSIDYNHNKQVSKMRSDFIDLIGMRVKTFTVKEMVGRDKWKNIKWLCKCDCGQTRVLLGAALRSGSVLCKCQKRKMRPVQNDNLHNKLNMVHSGMSDHPLYSTWNNMFHRCYNPKCKAYKNYGARGIEVCDKWLNFEEFVKDMGNKFLGGSLDRIDNNGPYSPGNCKWATRKEQNFNKRTNHYLSYNDETKTITQWAKHLGINLASFQKRLKLGLPPEKLFYKGVIPYVKRNIWGKTKPTTAAPRP